MISHSAIDVIGCSDTVQAGTGIIFKEIYYRAKVHKTQKPTKRQVEIVCIIAYSAHEGV
jgi:hypothetical protein